MNSMVIAPWTPGCSQVWKTRPIFTEWARNGDPVLGRDQVKKFHLSTLSSGNLRLKYDAMTATQKSAYQDAIRSSGYRYSISSVTIGAPLKRGTSVPGHRDHGQQRRGPDLRRLAASQLRLTDATGHRAWTKTLTIDLRKHLPGTRTWTTYATVPTTLSATGYTVSLGVRDRSTYSPDMYLANGLRRADGG